MSAWAIYYSSKVPTLANDNLTDDIADIYEKADLDEDQERKLEKEFAREYHLLTREDRLDRIGEDIVAHYLGQRSGRRQFTPGGDTPPDSTASVRFSARDTREAFSARRSLRKEPLGKLGRNDLYPCGSALNLRTAAFVTALFNGARRRRSFRG